MINSALVAGRYPGLQCISNTQFGEGLFPRNEKKDGTRKNLCPQITQMHADEALFSSASASIRVNLRAIPDSVAARRARPSAPFCGKSIETPIHEPFAHNPCKVQFHLIPLSST
jgi:hypothetical protein